MRVEKPSIVAKPWGREIFLSCNDKYVLEIMEINKGERTSLHYHKNRMETFYILSGKLRVNSKIFHTGDVVTFLPKEVHILKAIETTRIIEASTPELKDIVRIRDDYGRV